MTLKPVARVQDSRLQKIRQIEFSPDGQWCGVLVGTSVLLIETRTFTVARALATLDSRSRGIHSFCFHPDSATLFLGCSDGVIESHHLSLDKPTTAVKSTESFIETLCYVSKDRFLALTLGRMQYLDLQCLHPTVDFPSLYQSHSVSSDRRHLFLKSMKSQFTRGSVDRVAIYTIEKPQEQTTLEAVRAGVFFHQSNRIILIKTDKLVIQDRAHQDKDILVPVKGDFLKQGQGILQAELTGDDRFLLVALPVKGGHRLVVIDIRSGQGEDRGNLLSPRVASSPRGNLLAFVPKKGILEFHTAT